MLYISIADSYIEVIKTDKKFFWRESVKKALRKEIPEKVITEGRIVDEDKFREIIMELKNNEKEAAVLIPNNLVACARFVINTQDSTDLSKAILDKANPLLPGPALEFEHFYKDLKEKDHDLDIVYTAIAKKELSQFDKFFDNLGFGVKFLSARVFALYELIEVLIDPYENILYCDVDKVSISFFVIDKFGPKILINRKGQYKSFWSDLKNVLKDLKEKEIEIARVIIGNAGSIEITTGEAREELKIPIIKMGEIIDEICKYLKISFETEGTSKILLTEVIGLMLLIRKNNAPNFAGSLNTTTETLNTSVSFGPLGEERKSFSIRKFFASKLVIGVISTLVFFGLVMGFLPLTKEVKINLPFISSPTRTPTPTFLPTATPIPTIDPSLKRDDLKVLVQNGTDRTGYAKETAIYLEEKGYKNVARSNADKDDYEASIIKIKKEKKNYLPLITQDLKEKIDTTKVEELSGEEKYDVIIILGIK